MPERIGRYRVIRALGEGHFGAVWLAEGEVPAKGARSARSRWVAIKQLRGEWTMRAFETLVREFELLDRVKHRSLCRVYEFLDRECAVVMEYVEGNTLRQVLDAYAEGGEPVWPDAAYEIGCEIADCLYQAHATTGVNGEPLLLVHRDVKPENVMLTPTGEVKLLDFGLARIDDGVRDVGPKGTPLYMAPEQARGEGVEHRTDLFALGLVVFELLTGRPAYPIPTRDRDSEIEALMGRVQRADLGAELAALRRTAPDAADALARCLAPRPADRPEDGHAVMLELRRRVERRGALAEFAAYTFGPLGPLTTKGVGAAVARASPRAKLGHPSSGSTGGPAGPVADMMSRPSEPEPAPTMSKP
ncbi:MAG: serine/threonine-protein kinase, partial [Myxococcota bacterium]